MLMSAVLAGCGGGSSLPATSNVHASGSSANPVVGLAEAHRVMALATSAYASTVIGDGAVVYYQLNDTTPVLADSGPNGIAGAYGSGVTQNVAPLTTGGIGAASFPGGAYSPTTFTTTPSNAILQPVHSSVEAWIQTKQYNTTGLPLPIVSYGREANGSSYGLYLSSGNTLRYEQQSVGQSRLYAYGKTTFIPGKAYHLVVTSDGTNVNLYVNGALDGTKPYAGNISYSNTGGQGLFVGGPLQSTLPTFAGTIAQVAVYSVPLSPAQILNHFVTGQIAPMTTEPATSSDAFVDSIGINTHFGYTQSNYSTGWTTAAALLEQSGIRHIRDGMITPGVGPTLYSRFAQLGAAGVHGLFITSLAFGQSTIQSFPSQVGTSFEAFEAPNEQDDQNNPNWLSQCIAYQKSLYSWVKSDPQIAQYPVLGPALVSASSYPEVGNISSYLDYGNVHTYTANYNPGTPGWGSVGPYGVYGSIAYDLNLIQVTSGTKPVIATEAGFGTLPATGTTIDYHTDLRYIPRVFFDQFNAGIKRTYTYELLDDGGTPAWNNFGLITSTFTPKPAYTALKGLIGALADPGPAFTPAPLTYQITGDTNMVQHTLMGKRNGSYVIALWIETPGWNTSTGGDITVPNQTITVATANKFSSASLSTLDENGNLTTAALPLSANSASISVSDKITLVTLTP